MPIFNYSTRDQLAAALRIRFKTSKTLEALKIAEWFNLASDAELQNWFSISAAQLITLRAKLIDYVNRLNAVRTSVGQ